ncbi:MAG TPA: DUF4266 domain-containing protein [Polyangiaceae bacterium]|jgi:hypothetical protein|nr:DUF4266 domain-containing protein [Polyangiaceae bacterium]
MTIRTHFDADLAWKAPLSVLGVCIALASAGCATVRPEQRAILADPTMQFDAQSADQAALDHALDNREGSTGGGSMRGGGCGCN